MQRRTMIQACLGLTLGGTHVMAAMKPSKFDDAVDVLQQSTDDGAIAAASLYVRHRQTVLSRSFGAAKSEDAAFLLGSISKPIAIAAVMTLLDQAAFALDDPAHKYLPEFTAGDRDRITIRQLMTHCSGLPDQLRENANSAPHTRPWMRSYKQPAARRCCLCLAHDTAIPAWRSCSHARSPSGSAASPSRRWLTNRCVSHCK